MHDDMNPVERTLAERDRIMLHNYERAFIDVEDTLKKEAADRVTSEHDRTRESRIRRFGRRISDFVLSPRILWLTIRDARDNRDED